MSNKLFLDKTAPIKTILITGGTGFIGSHLAESLAGKYNLILFDNFRRNAFQHLGLSSKLPLELIEGDVLNIKSLRKAIKGVDIVIHLAAIAGVSSYEVNPLQTLEVDAWGTYHVLKIATEKKIKQVILFSSSEVYGPVAKDVTEESLTSQGPATESRWSYGTGKLVGDHFAFAFSKMKKLNSTIVRPFNIYGPRQVGEGAIKIFVDQALKNKNITIRGNGAQTRTWCYVTDLVDAIISMIGNPKAYNQIFNIGNPKTLTTIEELGRKIVQLTHSKSKILFKKENFVDVIYRSPDIQKARRILKFEPRTNLVNGLKSTIAWFKTEHAK